MPSTTLLVFGQEGAGVFQDKYELVVLKAGVLPFFGTPPLNFACANLHNLVQTQVLSSGVEVASFPLRLRCTNVFSGTGFPIMWIFTTA
jgi:hypothetical protein